MFELKPKRCGLILLVVSTLALPAHAGMDEATAFYEKQDYANAYSEFMHMAEIGNHRAQFNIGAMYYRGQHVAEDVVQSYAWMALAGQKGEKPWAELSTKVYESLDGEQKKRADEAKQSLFAKLSDAAVAQSLAPEFGLGSSSTAGLLKKRVEPEYPEAMRQVSRDGWVDVLFTVAPDGTTRNHTVTFMSDIAFVAPTLKALKGYQYQPTLVDGKPVAVYGQQYSIHYSIENQEYSGRKVRNMIDQKRSKAESGGPAAYYAFGHFLEVLPSFTGMQLDNSEFNQWYLRAALEGYGPAQFSLGVNLLYGRSCTADVAKSLRWLELSANQGQPDSQYLLAVEMLSGARIARNPEVAVKWLKRAADSQQQHAQLKLAWLYATSMDEKQRSPALAQTYLDKIGDDYADHLTLFETRAAVAAAAGDFRKAVEWQKKTVAEAERYELPIEGFSTKLAAYEAGKPWIEQS